MLSVREAAAMIGARASGPDARFEYVASDTRSLARNALFVALRGERFDGHAFAASALRETGAAAALVDVRSGIAEKHPDLPLVVVEDTRAGLAALATAWRMRFDLPVIGVCGSNGKTTTKEMIAAILRAAYGAHAVLATAGNLNNDIGLPLTVLGLGAHHRAAVIEIGMNHPGETAMLAAIARPTIGLVNNAQREHQEFMKSVAEVAAEHGALIARLPAGGIAAINADDEYAGYWRSLAGRRRIVDFGLGIDAGTEALARAKLAIPGEHNVRNALAAAAAARAAGVASDAIGAGLAAFTPAKGRLQTKTGSRGATVIDDTYNANPDSMRAAIDVLTASRRPRLLVIGDMGEVGDAGPAYHEEIGGYARARGIERMLATGELMRHAVRAFGANGEHFDAIEPLIERACALAEGSVLVKGSRFMRMERVVERLTAGGRACS